MSVIRKTTGAPPTPTEVQKEMSFLDHLEELRWRIIRSLTAVVAFTILLFILHKWFFDYVIFGPVHEGFPTYGLLCRISDSMCFGPPEFTSQAVGFGESFIISIKAAFMMGLVLAMPYILWQFWQFIRPGLYPKEQKGLKGIVLVCSFLFLMGASFGYFIIAPFAINFLMGYTIPGVENVPTISSYINYMIMFVLPAGLIFELPVLVYFLSKIGLVTPDFMRKYRRHSIIIILMLAAILTPPDVVTQMLIGIPLYILYEISILISARIEKKAKEENT